MNTTRRLVESERGTTLIMVGLSAFVLMGLSAFVLDLGVMWLARRQAQNAADAGAMAGAIARAYDETANPPSGSGAAFQSATTTALLNPLLGTGATAEVLWECPLDYVTAGLAGVTDCVRVNVYRDGTNSSTPLPRFFAALLPTSAIVGTKAMATAWARTGNTTNCMRPFSVADKWIEQWPSGPPRPPTITDEYDHWISSGPTATQVTPAPPDMYIPPSPSGPGTGYQLPADFGAQVVLTGGNNPQSVTGGAISPGWSLPVQLPDGAGGWTSGASDVRTAIGHCIGHPVSIGQYLPTENGVMNGPISQGVGDLVALDPTATWTGTTVTGTCAPVCAPMSPRIVPIAVFDLDEFQYRVEANDWNDPSGNPVCPIGGRCVKVVNILGFFVQGMSGPPGNGDVLGILITMPGTFVTGQPTVGGGAGFLQVIQLIR